MSASTFRIDRATRGAQRSGNDILLIETGSLRFTTLTTTVPKELVHRVSVSEVLLTGWERRADDRFALTAQWPRGHSFFTSIDGCHDPLIAVETVRQAGILLAHAEYRIPQGHHFLVNDLGVAVRPRHLRVEQTPASLDLDVRCVDVKERGGAVTGFRIEVDIHRDGSLAATGSGTLTSVAPRVYERLRAARGGDPAQVLPLTAPVSPQTVGRMSPMDVVLSPAGGEGTWQLRVDTRHPALFDHAVDHVPGMLLLEAARQAAVATAGPAGLPLEIAGEFLRYVELNAPCMIEAHPAGTRPDGTRTVLVSARQDTATVFRCTVTLAPPPA
ncbi:ScbA/BarX family gamma-butyrolactone biosynthesis protein [Streptomyces sp. NPDC002499]